MDTPADIRAAKLTEEGKVGGGGVEEAIREGLEGAGDEKRKNVRFGGVPAPSM